MRSYKSLSGPRQKEKLFGLTISLIFLDAALSCWISIMGKGAQGSERSKYSPQIPKDAEQILEKKYT